MLNTLCLMMLPLLMLYAAASDIASMRIPNWLTGLIAILFFPMAYLTSMPLQEFGMHCAAGASLFVAGYIMFSLRLFGGGDAKLMAAAGLWFGTTDSVKFLVATGIAGGVLALSYVVWSVVMAAQAKDPEGKKSFRSVLRSASPKLPYGCALAVGAIHVFPASWWAQAGIATL